MKNVTRILMAVSIVGLFIALVLANSIYASTKETIASVTIILMSAVNIVSVLYIKELFPNNKVK